MLPMDALRLPRFDLKLTHVIPILVQTLLLAYWALHWPPLRERLGFLVWCIPVAVGLDALLHRARRGELRFGAGAVPVVLSSTLFTNYPPRDAAWMLLVVALALMSKAFLRRGAQHIFNPSAFGLSVLAALSFAGVARTEDVAHHLSSPPLMTELILALALLPQLRLPIVSSTLGAAASILAVAALQPLIRLCGFEQLRAQSLVWSPVLLVLVLLLTDPATSPRSAAGRFLFGAFIGVAINAIGSAMTASGESDFWSKVLAIPLANALVPWFQRVGERLDARWLWLSPRYNRRHVAAWVVIASGYLWVEGKAMHLRDQHFVFQQARPPLLRAGADGVPSCEENPLYCRPFAIGAELRCWAAEWRSEADRCGDSAPLAAEPAPRAGPNLDVP